MAAVTTVDSARALPIRQKGWRADVLPHRSLIYFLTPALADLIQVRLLDEKSPPHHASVPALFPSDMADLDPQLRKRYFLEGLRPIARFHNSLQVDRRKRIAHLAAGKTSREGARPFIEAMARTYKLGSYPRKLPTLRDTLRVLTYRVGPVPIGMLLGQAVLESGWGTSKLSRSHHNLFGQKTGSGGYARFDHIGASVESYINNLNTHAAYAGFREARLRQRRDGTTDLNALLSHLRSYSTRGPAYIKDLTHLIRRNHLDLASK